MITIYGFGRVPELVVGLTRDLRVLWAAEELGLPYQVHALDFETDLRTDSYKQKSDFGQIPAIEDEGFVLSESGAILLYMAEKAGAITAADVRRRYEVTRWCIAALSTLEPPMTVLNLLVISRSPDTETKALLTQWVEMRLDNIDKRLNEHAYIIDETFTVADVLVVTMLRMLAGLGIVEKFANVRAYLTRCEERPAWQKVLDAYEDRLHAQRGTARRTIPERLAP
jgi:glutathione S-transferase